MTQGAAKKKAPRRKYIVTNVLGKRPGASYDHEHIYTISMLVLLYIHLEVGTEKCRDVIDRVVQPTP
jgi:hypothetical protein